MGQGAKEMGNEEKENLKEECIYFLQFSDEL